MPKIKPTPAFLSVFMEAVAEQYRWAAAIEFEAAVKNCLLAEHRESVIGVYLRHNYMPTDVTDARLKACIDHIFPVPTTFKIGDVVKYIGSDLQPVLGDKGELIITDVSAGVTASEYGYAAGGVAWIKQEDLQFVRLADEDSIETAWFSTQTEDDDSMYSAQVEHRDDLEEEEDPDPSNC